MRKTPQVALACLAFFLSISGCKKEDTPAPVAGGGAVKAPSANSGERHRIAFVTNQIASFWNIAKVGCEDAAKDLGVEVDVRMPAEATAVEQKRIVEDLLTSGIDALAISPLDADNQTAWINSVAERVPLITHDSDAPGTTRLCYIGMDNYRAGRMAGELVQKALPEGGKVVVFIGRLEQDNAKYRRQGVIDVLIGRDRDAAYYKNQPNAWDPVEGEIKGEKYTILATITDQGKPEVAQRKAADAINTYPQMNAMVGLFAYNPPACYQALSQAGKLRQIQLIGFDEDDATLSAIKEGSCIGTVVQNPYEYGYQSVKMLKAILDKADAGIPEGKSIDIPARSITIENVDEFWADLKAKAG